MKNVFSIVIALLTGLGFSAHSMAASSEVDWVKPEDYSDIRPANENRSRFHKRIFERLDEHFSELAAKLPADQTLKVQVHNLDLAGDVRYMMGPNNSTIRVVKDIYFPKMRFSYQLVDKNDSEVTSGEADIKDMSFNTGIRNSSSTDSFYYEKEMISDWFKKTFLQPKNSSE